MKANTIRYIVLLIMMLALVQTGCKSTKSISNKENTESTVERDGSSFKKAIVVKSIEAEYDWVRKNYPGSQIMQQSLTYSGKKPYDILTFQLPDGTKRDFYFDISPFFGKGF